MRRKTPPIVNEHYWMKRMFGSSLSGRVRSAAPIAATAKPTRRTVGVTSEVPDVEILHDWNPNSLTGLSDGDPVTFIPDDGVVGWQMNEGDEGGTYISSGVNGQPGIKMPSQIGGTFDTEAYSTGVSSPEQHHDTATLAFIAEFLTSNDIPANPSPGLYLQSWEDIQSDFFVQHSVDGDQFWLRAAYEGTSFNIQIDDDNNDASGLKLLIAQLRPASLVGDIDCKQYVDDEWGEHNGIRWFTAGIYYQDNESDWTFYRARVYAGHPDLQVIWDWASSEYGVTNCG